MLRFSAGQGRPDNPGGFYSAAEKDATESIHPHYRQVAAILYIFIPNFIALVGSTLLFC